MSYIVAMNAFPVIDSILSPRALESWLSDTYGLDVSSCSVLKINMNHTYRVVTATGRFILRIYSQRFRNEMQVDDELRLLHHLNSSGLRISVPQNAPDGSYIQLLLAPEGPRLAVLFSFAPGRKERFLTTEMCRRIGAAVGKMHLVAQPVKLSRADYNIETLTGFAIKQVSSLFGDCAEEMNIIHLMHETLSEAFLTEHSLQKGVVHLDIWYDNLAVSDAGEITFYDFDNCGNGWLILDIGYFCLQLFFIETDKTVYEAKKAAFLEGYRSVMSISDEELKLTPHCGLAIWIHYLGLQTERFEHFANLFLSANYLKMYLGRATEWMEYNSIK